MVRYTILVCLLVFVCASGAVLPDTQLLSDQTALPSNDLSSDSAWMLPGFSSANVTCHITCNDVAVDANELQLGSEAKSCVGSFKVFCKSAVTDKSGVFGFKCEGKSTAFAGSKTISICEGAFQSFGKKSFKTSEGKLIRSTKAYGCLGTTIGVKSNSSNNADIEGIWMSDDFRAEDSVTVDATLAGEKAVKEGRCEGLSGRFMAVKVGGKCDKHGKHGDKDADKHSKHADKDAEQQPQDDFHPDGPLSEEPRPDMPGARRSLAGHHDKKHHGGKHGDHKGHHEHLDVADMTFEDVQDKVEHQLQRAGVELLPHDVPSGSLEGPPKCSITCNGRHTWFGAFFPCFGKLEIDCGAGQSVPPTIAGSNLAVAGPDNGFAFHGTCKGYWSGALFKTCKGFSTAHVEAGDKSVWDFCAGKKAVRMGGAPGKGFYSSSWCKGKDLVVVEKDEETW